MSALVSLAQPVTSLSAAEPAKIQKAQRYVGAAMGTCLGLWFLPLVSGPVVSFIESKLVDTALKTMGCYSEAASEKVYWFFRQKTFFLFGATYIPFAGVPLQLFQTYGLGQFAIHCALRPELLTDGAWLEQSWKEVESDIFSGDHAIQSYEQSTGRVFPHHARSKFLAAVDSINEMYLASQRFPGAVRTQELAGKTAHQVTRAGKAVLKGLSVVAAVGGGVAAGIVMGIFDLITEDKVTHAPAALEAATTNSCTEAVKNAKCTLDQLKGSHASPNSPEVKAAQWELDRAEFIAAAVAGL